MVEIDLCDTDDLKHLTFIDVDSFEDNTLVDFTYLIAKASDEVRKQSERPDLTSENSDAVNAAVFWVRMTMEDQGLLDPNMPLESYSDGDLSFKYSTKVVMQDREIPADAAGKFKYYISQLKLEPAISSRKKPRRVFNVFRNRF